MQYVGIASFGPRRFAKPVNVFNRVLDANALHVDPFGRGGHFGGIVPEEFLAEMKAKAIAGVEEESKVVERSRQPPAAPRNDGKKHKI